MKLKYVNIKKISELLSVHKNETTCIECCKYYTVPSTAKCGHSLCHSCWRYRKVCPYDGHNIDRKTLMLNIPLQVRTENVINVIREFEEAFNIKYDSDINLVAEYGSNKNVNTWLANNENDISNLDMQYQESIPKDQDSLCLIEPDPIPNVEQITCKVQIHSETKKVNTKNIACVTVQQDDTKNVSFFQKGPLNNNKSTFVKTADNDSLQSFFNKISSSDNDEIEITIKTGTTLTNICINKKENDIKLNINSEKQIQTCLKSNMENKSTSCTLDIHNNILNMNNNIVNNNEKNLKNKGNVKLNSKMLEVIEKSTPSKKGTASADTISIQNEITENIQAELVNSQNDQFGLTQIASKLLNTPNNPETNEVFIQNNTQSSQLINKPKPNEVLVKNNTQMQDNIAEVESINIFNSEPVEETNARVQSRKSTKNIQNPKNSQLGTDTRVASQLLNKSNEPKIDDDELIESNTQHTSKILNDIAEEVQSINSIFDSEPIGETNIQSLKSAKKTPSTILTLKSNISKSHRVKRNRDFPDLRDFPISKKRKLQNENEHSGNLENIPSQLKFKKKKTTVLETDSESFNYEKLSQLLENEKIKSAPNTIITEKSKINLCKNKMLTTNDKCSENIFSLSKESPDSDVLITANFKTYDDNIKSQANKRIEELEITKKLNKLNKQDNLLSPVNDLEVIEISTPEHDDSDKSVVEDTPQKAQSFTINNKKTTHTQNAEQLITTISKPCSRNIDRLNIMNLTDIIEESSMRNNNVTVVERIRESFDTPLTITQFAGQITYKSTPVARKSLNFNKFEDGEPEPTPGLSSFVAAKTTQEKEFLLKAFDTTLCSQPLVSKSVEFYVAGSCLSGPEQAKLKLLCSQRHWVYMEKYTKEVSHLVVGVDEENKSQRSVKYMCALAAAKWIISFHWVEKCLQTKSTVNEVDFEVLDGTGEPGPRRSRLAKRKIFEGITFYCMPPFTVLDVDTLKDILRTAGGRVVEKPEDVRVKDARPALLLAEPENTPQDDLIYLAMDLDVVPVNFEWVLNCLGSYTLGSIHELLLYSSTLLPKATKLWPSDLISRDFN